MSEEDLKSKSTSEEGHVGDGAPPPEEWDAEKIESRGREDVNALDSEARAVFQRVTRLPVETIAAAFQHDTQQGDRDERGVWTGPGHRRNERVQQIMNEGDRIVQLRGNHSTGQRYWIVGDAILKRQSSRVYRATDREDDPEPNCLVKEFGFDDEALLQNPAAHAAWRREERILRRLGSAGGASACLMNVTDMGTDPLRKSFITVLKSRDGGYSLLSDGMPSGSGSRCWSSTKISELNNAGVRREWWSGFGKIAKGIAILHQRHVLHRRVRQSSIFMREDTPATMRLGDFQWSLQLTYESDNLEKAGENEVSPGIADAQHSSFRRDWYDLGVALGTFFCDCSEQMLETPEKRHNQVVNVVSSCSHLLASEKQLILSLLSFNEPVWLSSPRLSIQRICADLFAEERGVRLGVLTHFVKVLLPKPSDRAEFSSFRAMAEQDDFIPDPKDPSISYDPKEREHQRELLKHLNRVFETGRLFRMRKTRSQISKAHGTRIEYELCLVSSKGLVLDIRPNRPDQWSDPDAPVDWSLGFSAGLRQSGFNVNRAQPVLTPLRFKLVSLDAEKSVKRGSWRELFCQELEGFVSTAEEPWKRRFRFFVRLANQVDLLMTFANIIRFRRKGERLVDASTQMESWQVELDGDEREQWPRALQTKGKNLYEFLDDLIESDRRNDRNEVIVSTECTWNIREGVIASNSWTIDVHEERDKFFLFLRRPIGEGLEVLPEAGFMRPKGFHGQSMVVQRRQNAIDRLVYHDEVVRALAKPQVSDRGDGGRQLVIAPELERKAGIIDDLDRSTPLYVLQGPPGTGKSTTVAEFVKVVFSEGAASLSQRLLVSAQANSAVDVLARKINNECGEQISSGDLLAVRLTGKTEPPLHPQDPVRVTDTLLRSTKSQLQSLESRTEQQEAWLGDVDMLLPDEGKPLTSAHQFGGIIHTVKNAAQLTYATTTSAALESYSSEETFAQPFDYGVIEEAGRIHVHEMIPALLASMRTTFVGDQAQLNPFRYEDYLHAMESEINIEECLELLGKLPYDCSVRDRTLWADWNELSVTDKEEIASKASSGWLGIFEKVHRDLRGAERQYLTREGDFPGKGHGAGLLLWQYRMHPSIGELISNAYYVDDPLQHGKEDHEFAQNLALEGIPSIDGQMARFTWIDVSRDVKKAVDRKSQNINKREAETLVRVLDCLRNPAGKELTLAIISPYRRQQVLIGTLLESEPAILKRLLHQGFVPVETRLSDEDVGVKEKSQLDDGFSTDPRRWVHTVDSFQGHEADVTFVSLVRDRSDIETPKLGKAFGFLRDAGRMNVALSRAKSYLVVVGSWYSFQFHTKEIEDPRIHESGHLRLIVDYLEKAFHEPESEYRKILLL